MKPLLSRYFSLPLYSHSSLISLTLSSLSSFAQLTVTNVAPYNDPNYLVQNILLNPGVTITNVTFNGVSGNPTGDNAEMIGYFDGSASNIGIGNGVILMTGPIYRIPATEGAPGPNDLGSAGNWNSAPGDADLDAFLAVIYNTGSTVTYNAAILEFDFTSASDKVQLKYVFASEEYPEWVCSQFTDVFAFFISGPGVTGNFIPGKFNMAIIPGTSNTPVAINTINNGSVGASGSSINCQPANYYLSHSQYYVDNGDGTTPGANPTVQFDGFTTVLTATSPTIIPCETYHMKICIADAGDGIYDSGVFLETASFGAAGFQVHLGDVETDNATVKEGCGPVMVIFSRSGTTAMPYTLHFTITGSADNGTDYAQFADSVVIPAGSSSITVPLDILVDGYFENLETIVITIPANTGNNTCLDDYPSEAVVTIINVPPLTMTVSPDTIICPGQTLVLGATPSGGVSPYTYSWSTGVMGSSITVSPAVNTTYTVTVTDECTTDTLIQQINIGVGGLLVTSSQQGPAVEGCSTTKFTFTRAGPISNPYTVYYTISGTAANGTDYIYITDSITIPAGSTSVDLFINPLVDFISEGTETVIITTIPDPNFFCATGPSVATATIANVDSIGLSVNNDTSICAGNTVLLKAVASGGTGPLQYVWDNGGGINDTAYVVPLDTTTYTVFVLDTCGNANARSVTVNVIPPASMLSVTNDIVIEGCKDAIVTLIRNDDTTQAISLFITISGGAANGTDYNFIEDTIFVPAGQGSTSFDIQPYFDGITEGNEEIIIALVVDTNCITFLTKDTIQIINVNPMMVTTGNDTILCTRGPASLTAQVTGGYGNYTFTWTDNLTGLPLPDNDTVIVNPFTTAQYGVLVTDECGNNTSGLSNVFLTGVSLKGDIEMIEGCDDIQIRFTRADSIGNLLVKYRIEGTSLNGIDYPVMSGTAVIPDGQYSATITVEANFDGQAENDETLKLTVVDNLSYDVCPDSNLTITIRNVEPLTIDADGDAVICTELAPLTVSCSGGVGPISYLWSTGDTDSNLYVYPRVTTLYKVYASDQCSTPKKSDSVLVVVDCEYAFQIPNAFTPNGDGLNDFYLPVLKGVKEYKMYIVDRWGDLIFYSDNFKQGWDGKVNKGKKEAQQDVYVYKIFTTDLLDNEYSYIGRVTLVK
ncbi:MAG: choice-of-anchor L domain-containing protein [Bacteroidetes bacterium]|nr:choice-of-anchor L domain-containing protein [Bacteroidota bacterium]